MRGGPYLVELEVTWANLDRLVFIWNHLNHFGLIWIRLEDSQGFTCSHLNSLNANQIKSDALGLTWLRLGSFGLTWVRLCSLGVTGSHLDSLGLAVFFFIKSRICCEHCMLYYFKVVLEPPKQKLGKHFAQSS